MSVHHILLSRNGQYDRLCGITAQRDIVIGTLDDSHYRVYDASHSDTFHQG